MNYCANDVFLAKEPIIPHVNKHQYYVLKLVLPMYY